MPTLFLLLPLVGALLALFLPRHREQDARLIALVFSALAFAVSIAIFVWFDPNTEGYQMVDQFTWISPSVGGFEVQYLVGIDGLSAPLVLLLGLLSVVAVLVSFSVEVRVKEYFAYLLLLETAVAGVFISLDLIQFLPLLGA